jgi:hypothetical protein
MKFLMAIIKKYWESVIQFFKRCIRGIGSKQAASKVSQRDYLVMLEAFMTKTVLRILMKYYDA